jgi:hypothetical protein
MKLLQWEKDSFALYEKHLGKGTFERTDNTNEATDMLLTHLHLQHIVQGAILHSVRKKRDKNECHKACQCYVSANNGTVINGIATSILQK